MINKLKLWYYTFNSYCYFYAFNPIVHLGLLFSTFILTHLALGSFNIEMNTKAEIGFEFANGLKWPIHLNDNASKQIIELSNEQTEYNRHFAEQIDHQLNIHKHKLYIPEQLEEMESLWHEILKTDTLTLNPIEHAEHQEIFKLLREDLTEMYRIIYIQDYLHETLQRMYYPSKMFPEVYNTVGQARVGARNVETIVFMNVYNSYLNVLISEKYQLKSNLLSQNYFLNSEYEGVLKDDCYRAFLKTRNLFYKHFTETEMYNKTFDLKKTGEFLQNVPEKLSYKESHNLLVEISKFNEKIKLENADKSAETVNTLLALQMLQQEVLPKLKIVINEDDLYNLKAEKLIYERLENYCSNLPVHAEIPTELQQKIQGKLNTYLDGVFNKERMVYTKKVTTQTNRDPFVGIDYFGKVVESQTHDPRAPIVDPVYNIKIKPIKIIGKQMAPEPVTPLIKIKILETPQKKS